jgi:hypothetical protein
VTRTWEKVARSSAYHLIGGVQPQADGHLRPDR